MLAFGRYYKNKFFEVVLMDLVAFFPYLHRVVLDCGIGCRGDDCKEVALWVVVV